MNTFRVIFAIVAALLLAACVARREPPDARGVSFPVREASYRKDGIVVAPETVRLVRPGLDKDQVRQLLGAPHFTEGLFFVHDWNYLLKLPQNGGWLDCQLQVQFDEHNRVRASYWRSGDCEALAPMAAAQVSPPVIDPEGTQAAKDEAAAESTTAKERPAQFAHWTLADLRFAFGRSTIGDLRRADRERLYTFAAQIGARAEQVHRIEIVGHADRLGSPTRKYQRSLARAQAVAEVFVASGVDPRRIDALGRSDTEAAAGCAAADTGVALRECLAPDRQVVVSVSVMTGGGVSRNAMRRR